MTDIIGKTIDEIRELDPDVDELSDRDLCYVVALGMDEVGKYSKGQSFNIVYPDDPSIESRQFPMYTFSWGHAGRVLESLPHKLALRIFEDGWVFHKKCSPHPEDWLVYTTSKQSDGSLKKMITKAAAKCVLEGIELEVK